MAVAGLKTADLVDMVYSVPREDLVGMIDAMLSCNMVLWVENAALSV